MSEPVPVPLCCMFTSASEDGEPLPAWVVQIVLVMSNDTMEEVAQKVSEHFVDQMFPKRDAGMVVTHEGKELPSNMTVEESKIEPKDNIYVTWDDYNFYANQ
ncbi:uncharacterized protein METZ01_LOCUS166633 [marine metagenome]|uniref:Ubiquitin-like domain-containing protein n=1 Tax=marine metagenome TaxID=408172 RepID=A0A382BJG7_9ZZZZ